MEPINEPPERINSPAPTKTQDWQSRPFAPVDISWLIVFRLAFGAIMIWHVWDYFNKGVVVDGKWRSEIEYFYIDPVFHFTYPGFDWVQPWPGPGMYLHFFAMGILAAFVLFGLHYRVSISLFFLAFTYQFLLDKANYQNHYYLICLVSGLLIFLPAHRAFSLDALLRPSLHSHTTPAWTLWLMRAQIGIPYFYGGIAKINADWLLGEPMRLGMAQRMDRVPLLGPYFTEEWLVILFNYGGLLIDLAVVPLLLWRRTRLFAYAFAVVFHLLNAMMFNIGIFPWFMIAATTVFFEPDWPRRLLLRLRGWLPIGAGASSYARSPVTTLADSKEFSPFRRRLTISLLATYVAVQLVVPFRHLLYPGDPSWTEQGHLFAWHMMLRAKSCGIRFYATIPENQKTMIVDLRPFLTARQLSKLGKDPDMILHFTHFLADELRKDGYDNAEIRVLDLVSLNGRKPQPLIDPTVNLADERRGWRLYPWILPLEEPLRRPAWNVPVELWERFVDVENLPQKEKS